MKPQKEALLSVSELDVYLGATRHQALAGVSFEVARGERVALLGPSGCGKSTLLRTIAGFERPERGSVVLDGRVLADAERHVPPHQRATGMVFQDYALFPHLSVAENVAFGLSGVARAERARRATELIELVGLDGLQRRKPGELSGGQQQRVALARALAPEPRLLLLDEPFSSLDSGLRAATRRHTEQVLSRSQVTAVLVTHDQAEAMAFAERLLVLRDGQVEQAGAPHELYRRPRNAFVANFVGVANVLPGDAQGRHALTALGHVALQHAADGPVSLCVRPEAIRLSASAPKTVVGRVVSREYQGGFTAYNVRGDGFEVIVHDHQVRGFGVGEAVSLLVSDEAAVLTPD